MTEERLAPLRRYVTSHFPHSQQQAAEHGAVFTINEDRRTWTLVVNERAFDNVEPDAVEVTLLGNQIAQRLRALSDGGVLIFNGSSHICIQEPMPSEAK